MFRFPLVVHRYMTNYNSGTKLIGAFSATALVFTHVNFLFSHQFFLLTLSIFSFTFLSISAFDEESTDIVFLGAFAYKRGFFENRLKIWSARILTTFLLISQNLLFHLLYNIHNAISLSILLHLISVLYNNEIQWQRNILWPLKFISDANFESSGYKDWKNVHIFFWWRPLRSFRFENRLERPRITPAWRVTHRKSFI